MMILHSSLFRRRAFASVGRIHSMSSDPSFLSSTINAVVKIFGTSQSTEILHPWGAPPSVETTGSGFIIPGRRIITNAHVVTNSVFIRAKKYKSGVMYKANVQAFGHACDLAILTVEDDRFWDGLNPLRLIDSLPDLSQILHIVGYPSGGDTICITRGIVSRIDVTNYKHSRINIQLPTLQVDAAINSGNSGGPVFVGNVVVGVAFQTLSGKENIGYVIPAPIVNRFVSQVEAGEQEIGFCCLGVHLQAMDNLPLREFFKMTESMSGVLVTGEMVAASAHPLALYDIILEIDGLHIQDDGEVVDKKVGLHLNGYIALKEIQEKFYLKVLRKGDIIDISANATVLYKNSTTDYPSPPYLKCGPFILRAKENKSVFISQGLEDGYTSFANRQVIAVNGDRVQTLEEVARCWVAAKKYVVIHMSGKKIAVIKKKATNKSK